MLASRAKLRWALGLSLACLMVTGCAQSKPMSWTKSLAFWKQEEAGPNIVTPAEKVEQLRELGRRMEDMPEETQREMSLDLARQLQQEDDNLVRAQLLRTLASIQTPMAASMLKAGTRDSHADVRVACCEAWGRRGGPEAVEMLTEVLQSDLDIDVRLAAARALGEVHDPGTPAALGKALDDDNPALRHRAILSLRRVSDRDFGDDLDAWREFAQGGNPPQESWVSRIKRWF